MINTSQLDGRNSIAMFMSDAALQGPCEPPGLGKGRQPATPMWGRFEGATLLESVLATEVGSQHLRDADAAIGLLMVFEHRHEGASNGQA